jgi:hypothetical protein
LCFRLLDIYELIGINPPGGIVKITVALKRRGKAAINLVEQCVLGYTAAAGFIFLSMVIYATSISTVTVTAIG